MKTEPQYIQYNLFAYDNFGRYVYKEVEYSVFDQDYYGQCDIQEIDSRYESEVEEEVE